MSDTNIVVETTPEQRVETKIESSPFSGNVWSETVPEIKKEEVKVEAKTDGGQSASTTVTEEKEEILDTDVWFKSEFKDYGWDSIEKAKNDISDWKKAKENHTAAEIKFENDQSKLIHELIREGKTKEVREFLETQEKLEAYLSGEVNKNSADDIIKLGMKLKYKDLTDSEINYKFNKQYSLPKAPVQDIQNETDDDFAIRKAAWQEQVDDIEMSKLIDAKLARPDLESAKAKLVLPEISKPQVQEQKPTQESLDALEKIRTNFLNTLQSNYSKVDGFTTKVKDESVEIPIAFKIPDEDKIAIKGRLEAGFNVDEYIDKRWFDENGNPKIEQIITDIYDLENREKVLSGIANNAASQRLDAYRKEVKNIDINANGKTAQQTFQPGDKARKVSPFSKDAWSEKPPVIVNTN